MITVRRYLPVSTGVLYGGALGNDDFSKIFGKQEAAERRIRDLAREYHRPPPKQPDAEVCQEESRTSTTTRSSKILSQEASKMVEDPPDSVAKAKNTTKVARKYVPPSSSI